MKRANGLIWLCAGLVMGSGFTYLFSSRKGRRLRRQLYRMAGQYGRTEKKNLFERKAEMAASRRRQYASHARVA